MTKLELSCLCVDGFSDESQSVFEYSGGSMQRKFLMFFVSTLVVAAAFGMAFAAEGGNARKGKFLSRKHCRSCHGVSASDLSPATKTQKEWKALFSDSSKIPCNAQWPAMPESDVKDIFTYLHDYAKDSPSPAKCS
jgi:mono/diheme cytochrome c family protein